MCAVEDGKVIESILDQGYFKIWDTGPQTPGEGWEEYCRRTAGESLSALSSIALRTDVGKSLTAEGLYFVPMFAVTDDPRHFVPRDKHDHATAAAAVAAGYPAVEAVLPELLVWMQNCNWPVANTLEPLLAGIGLPLAPYLRRILETDDEIWKYWIINRLISESRDLALELKDELTRIVTAPTESEREEELDEWAKEVLLKYGLLDTK